MASGRVVILTGLPGSGKSTLCHAVVEWGRALPVEIKGVLSPPVFDQEIKTGIDLVDLSTGFRHRLAALRQSDRGNSKITTRRWSFDPQKMEIGSQILHASVPCELLVVDELGPLEFERGEGWLAGLAAVDSGEYRAALVVVRLRLVAQAIERWPEAEVVEIQSPELVPSLLGIVVQKLGLAD